MPDLSRGYRSWLWRRLSMLAPACGGAGLLVVHHSSQMFGATSMLWIHFASLCLALFLLAFTGWLTLRCVSCYFSHRKMLIPLRRRTRRELSQAGWMGMVCLSLLPVLALLPGTFRDISRSIPTHLLEVTRLLKVTPPRPTPEERKMAVQVVERPARPTVKPQPPTPEKNTEEPSPLPLQLHAVETQPAYVYSFQEEEKTADPWTFVNPPRLDRLGVPDPLKPFDWMLPQVQVGFLLPRATTGTLSSNGKTRLYLEDDLDMRSAGFHLEFDVPVSRDDSLLLLYEPIGFSSNADLADDPDGELGEYILWQRLGIFYAHRFAGYTSESIFDFSVTAGMMGDSLLTVADGGIANEVVRLSPAFGMELGLWQQGPAGFLLNLNQALPLNLTGATARVTEISVRLRIDFTRSLSIHFGYFAIRGRFQDFAGKMTTKGAEEEMEVSLSGPTFGIDLRF